MNKLILLGVLLLSACTTVPDGIAPVRDFEAERYLGTWHEIARLDHAFERGLSQVTATYTEREDGLIGVLNRGYQADEGQWQEAQGTAKFVTATNTAHLGVSFFGPFRFSYVVFALDPDYQWAYVTGHNRNYLWLLSRTPQVSAQRRADFIAQARTLGYATEELIWVEQTPVVKESEHASD